MRRRKWREDFKTTLKFNAGPTENVEEFIRELDHHFKDMQVENEEQRYSTLVRCFGDIVLADHRAKTEQYEVENPGKKLTYSLVRAYLLVKWKRLETKAEILKKLNDMKQGAKQDMRAFLSD
eukprot:SAG11_NODE_2336_length_3502_cov_6.183368_1_plen_122_part_00